MHIFNSFVRLAIVLTVMQKCFHQNFSKAGGHGPAWPSPSSASGDERLKNAALLQGRRWALRPDMVIRDASWDCDGSLSRPKKMIK
jgi:hypothetical protein